ncbi:hypothetical protein PACTADRAFT_51061 [Pachysolen tannophilus NRRL Y-2460]|uniref:Uncharacterized protein n=1 Tax=Pachysolen tannophilus NRRL Y-2460 TaxID=669874 RepID=A0A1E4TR04_PACTA|nr:hypothetical protein PACTADRAFT_51061 [Pachysolen tannophilus NRRL Y-2460]
MSLNPDDYIPTIDAILSVSDLEKITVKKMRNALQELFDVDLTPHKKLEKEDQIMAAKLQLSLNSRALRKELKTSSANKKRKTPKREGSTNSGGLMKPMKLSPKLMEFLQKDNIPRTEVVKLTWDYIKEHNLQNPADRREILCDDKMEPIFGKKMTMFSMNKLLSNHIFPVEEE